MQDAKAALSGLLPRTTDKTGFTIRDVVCFTQRSEERGSKVELRQKTALFEMLMNYLPNS